MSLLVLFSITGGGRSLAQTPTVTFTRYRAPSTALAITSGPDDALWYAGDNRIGRITTSGVVTEYLISSASTSIVAGPDGALWFTEWMAHKIGRITTAGMITEYSIPCCGVPLVITAGPDCALWFTESNSNKIGRITTDGVVTEYPLPTPGAVASVIAVGPDSALWFGEYIPSPPGANGLEGINRIGRITTTGAVIEYALPPSSVYQGLSSIVAGSDGAMWFTEYYTGAIGRISMAGVVIEYGATTGGFPTAITMGPDGALWYLESSDVDWVHTIGRITTTGAFTEYSAPIQNTNGGTITLGPDGALWFTNAWSLDPAIVRAVIESETLDPRLHPEAGLRSAWISWP